MRIPSRYLVVVLAVLAMAGTAVAQTFTGGLRGAVRDANGVIPGVTVTLLNENTGASRDAVSNDQGQYNFAAVPPGTYTVKAELAGFKTYEQKALRIAAQQFATVDVTLEVGQLQETITVTGAAPLIDTSTATGGGVISTEQLSTLPSGGRSAFLFAVTLPTVVASGDPQFNRQQDQTNASLLSLGGGTRRGNNYLIDGVPVTDIRNRASANPSIEALDDVAVQVHQYDAETGRTGGGTFNVATRSGTNRFSGSGFYQTRPRWGMANNFFSEKEGNPLPDTYFYLGGGGFGGPVVKNRTFFWYAMEGYSSDTTRSSPQIRLPTAREKAGDFSQSFDESGNRVTIYDPLTGNADGTGRTPFPGNVIPSNRLSPVAVKMLSYLKNPTNDVSNGLANYFSTAEIKDKAMMYTGKVDHRINDKVSLAGFYLFNKTDEPCANYLEPGLDGPNRFIDNGDYILSRRVHVLALNNTWLPSSNTVLTLRYGWTQFRDDDTLSIAFDPASLGFNPAFSSAIQTKKFPNVNITDYYTLGAIDPSDRNLYSWSANGTLSKLIGRHTIKMGGDYRTVGIDTQSFADGAGTFEFDRRFTSANPNVNGVNGANPSGNGLASLLLGYPSGDPGNLSSIQVSAPANYYLRYFGGYIQDDFRVSAKLTVNAGLRVERETGLREEENRFTVAFDRTIDPGGALGSIVNPLTGQPIRGGLVYAGVNGAPTEQGNQPAAKFSPRVGMVYSVNPKTVIRGGYGVYQAPWNYQFVGSANYGQVGYSQNTFIQQGQYVPTTSLTNPFPGGVVQPRGNALGALEGVGGNVDFIDQDKKAPYVQQYSIDINRELPGNVAVGFEYNGATGRQLGLGGSNDGTLNINQLDPQYLSLGTALQQQVPNPFFGTGTGYNPTSPTVTRAQLLRPFPQFGNLIMRQNTSGKNQYHAAIFKFEKRMSNGWGGRVNYTWSRLKDNQFGETNTYSSTNGNAQNAYDIGAEYGYSLLDVPRKLVLSPIFQLPFGEGKKWATSGVGAAILGDWTISSIIAFETGFPISVSNSSNNLSGAFNLVQRPDLTGTDPLTSGSRDERLFYTGADPGAWLNSAGFVNPGLFTLGTNPRTNPDLRTPHRNNWDFVASKEVRLGGTARAQIRLEVLNITNTVKTAGPTSTFGSSSFGRIATQRGFMRLTQLMFRMSF
ncbi:MAG TPA: TonB-dependent receptor [Vicinamibacterales bacterium]|nr:TonB-dependent receptor [Vicinamibacterales bacterium]